MPDEAFFHRNLKIFGLGQTNWADKFWGIWGIFGRFISTHFGTVSPLNCPYAIMNPLGLQPPMNDFVGFTKSTVCVFSLKGPI